MKNLKFIIWILIVFNTNSFAGTLKAGIASEKLTPPLEMQFALGGYGARMSKPAEAVHDDIWVKSLVIKDAEKEFALVTLDILALPPNVKTQVIDALGSSRWSMENVLLLPSHSHTSLDMTALNDKNILNSPQIGIYQPELLKFVIDVIVNCIKSAGSELQPVKVGTGRVQLDGLNRNRRHDEMIDPDLTVTRIDLLNGNPLAVLVNWTAHPTFMDENDMWVSAGWPGYLQRELEAWIGHGVTAMYYNGAQGDLSPVEKFGASHYEKAERYGRTIAKHAFQLHQSIYPHADIVFDYYADAFELPERSAHPKFAQTGGGEYAIDDQVMKIILDIMSPEKVVLNSLRLGDLIIAGTPGELICELGLKVKSELRARVKYPVIGGLANEWISYILSEKEYHQSGYETSVSFYGPFLGDIIVNAMIKNALELTK